MTFTHSSNRCLTAIRSTRLLISLGAFFVLAAVGSLGAQEREPIGDALGKGDAPAHLQKEVAVMVELNDAPAAVTFGAALKTAQAQRDASRTYALKHPTAKGSKQVLADKSRVEISSADAARVLNVISAIKGAQSSIVPALTGAQIGGKVLFTAQRVYNGIAVLVSPDKIKAILALPGVKGVHALNPKFPSAAFSDIDFVGGRALWTKNAPPGIHGDNIKVGDIDTGLDYIHTNFGGPGDSGYAGVPDHTVAPNAYFPKPKVPGGYDFAGDNYDADSTAVTYQPIPHPDPDPFDCAGHGTGTASLIGGYGVDANGFTYAGSYDNANPNMANLTISPGYAPYSMLYPVKVFGCVGSTDLVVPAIEWCMDPNGDGNFSDRMDAINMSLGSRRGYPDDPDAIASSIAAASGVMVVCSMGNDGDSYYIAGAPGVNSGGIAVAATYNDQNGYIYDSRVKGNQPAALATQTYNSVKPSGSGPIPPGGLTGDVVYAIPADGGPAQTPALATPLTNAAQCSGKIVLLDRGGGVSFEQKARRAFASGAIGVIIANNANNPRNDFPPLNVGLFYSAPVPVVGISFNDGNALKAAAAFDPGDGHSTTTPPANVTLQNAQGSAVVAPNPPNTSAQSGSPDTLPSYSSRGPRYQDSAIKPDLAAPAEVTGVAATGSGEGFMLFNGTSSAAPHVTGEMALLKQLHLTWSNQELFALACETATHDLYTTSPGASPSPTPAQQIGVSRVGAGRIDLAKAAAANVVAYNGTDPNLIGVSFGSVEAPVDGTTTLTKNITVTNKGANPVTYNVTYAEDVAVPGATFSFPTSSFTVNAGATMTIPVQLTVVGNQLKHLREASVAPTLGGTTPTNGNPRQWVTEKSGYAVFTPTSGPEPYIRVALLALPKPTSAMHATITKFVPTSPNTGSFNINLSGAGVNSGPNLGDALGNGGDVVSLVKPFELQYQDPSAASPASSDDRDRIRYVGVTSDYPNRTAGAGKAGTRIVFGLDYFGNAVTPDFAGSDREIVIDSYTWNPMTNTGSGGPDGDPDFQIFVSSLTGQINAYLAVAFNLHTGATVSQTFINGLLSTTSDTNAYNNSAVAMRVGATAIGLLNGSGTGNSVFQYQVVSFDRYTNLATWESPLLTYDIANPGLEVEASTNFASVPKVQNAGALFEDFMFKDLPGTSLPVNYNGTNFRNNGSIGVLLLHMHNATGAHSDVVVFSKPTITSFTPTSGPVGTNVQITGSNFNSGTSVTFNNVPATSVNVISPNTLIAQVPAGATTGRIRVINAAGTSTSSSNFTVTP